jgi:N-acetylneuraminic acid mutarotase
MAAGRGTPVLVALQNGKVLVVGNATTSGNCEIFDPATGLFTPTGAMSEAKTNFRAVLLPSGKVLVTGGVQFAAASSRVELYDPSAGTWSQLTPLRTGRIKHTMTVLQDGRILLAGGQITDTPANFYAPLFTGWDPIGAVPLPGNSTEIYDLTLPVTLNPGDSSAAQGTANAFLTESRYSHSAALLPNGKVIIFGGYGSGTAIGPNGQSANAELWDPATDTFSLAVPLSVGRNNHTATQLPSGDVVVVGGTWADAVTEIYRP